MNIECKKRFLAMLLFCVFGFQQNAYAILIEYPVTIVDFEDYVDYLGMPVENQFQVGPDVNADWYPVNSRGYEFYVGPENTAQSFNDLHVVNSITGSHTTAEYTDYIYAYNGTAILSSHFDTTMVKTGGGLFNLNSFDFSGVKEDGVVYEGSVSVTGIFGNGSSITQIFGSDGFVDGMTAGGTDIDDFQTFYMGEGWTGLSSVTFTHTGNMLNGTFDLDNIHVSAVPVPAAVWLFGSGLFGLMGFARTKSRK